MPRVDRVKTNRAKWYQQTLNFVAEWGKKAFMSPLFLPIFIFIAFQVASIGITGPAYLSDEIGYLTKASTVAGNTVHMASSWYGGYSILIAPAFLISHNPYVEYFIILVINALMWAGTTVLLQWLIKKLRPDMPMIGQRLVALGTLAFPSWVAMSGYVFPTSAFVLVLMVAYTALIKSRLRNHTWLVIAGLASGFLAWIHPLGYLFVALFAALLAVKAIVDRRWLVLVSAVAAGAMALLYHMVIAPAFTTIMNGSDTFDSHYAVQVRDLFASLGSAHYWLLAGANFIGLLFYVVIATFGLIIYLAIPTLRTLLGKNGLRKTLDDSHQLVAALSIISVLGVIVFISLTTGEVSTMRPDQWVYGRYTDMFLLPAIALGLLSNWRKKQAFIVASLVFVAGFFLQWVANLPGITEYTYVNEVNIQGFWPFVIFHYLHHVTFWLYGIMGALGVVVVGYFGTHRRKVWLLLLLVPMLVIYGTNWHYHLEILHDYSHVTSLYNDVSDSYPFGTCIGFAPGSDPSERFNIYSFYLHNDNLRLLTIPQWLQQCKGEGIYLSYNFDAAAYPQLHVIGREVQSSLLVVVPKNNATAASAFSKTTASFIGDL